MQRSITAFHRAEAQRTQAEQRYLETVPPKDPMEELEARLFLHDLASVASLRTRLGVMPRCRAVSAME